MPEAQTANQNQTVDITITWQGGAQLALIALEAGTAKGKAQAQAYIFDMASKLDTLAEANN